MGTAVTGEHDRGHGLELKSSEQTGDARAQDEGAIGLHNVIDLGQGFWAFTASIRSMGAFARIATSSGRITSVVIV